MLIKLHINQLTARILMAILTLSVCTMLVMMIASNFIIGVLTDERTAPNREALALGSSIFPNSARLHARLAAALEQENDLAGAEAHAVSAARLSPYNFNFKLLLASVNESSGKLEAAEQSLKAALALAPNQAEAHWQMANLWLREKHIDAAIDEFRAAAAINKQLLPVSLNLVWRASGEDARAIKAVASGDARAQIALAMFLLKQSRAEEATVIFNAVDRKSRSASSDGKIFLNALIAAGQLELARAAWIATVSDSSADDLLVWNGGFELPATKELAQFDWEIRHSDFAKFKITTGAAHSGTHALRIDFTGRDTTYLDGEVRQLLAVRSGARYKLEAYAKADKLITTEGLRLAITNGASAAKDEWLVTSTPIIADQDGWQHLELEFTAPQTPTGRAQALYATFCRKPKFSYDEPTRGTIWLDDFRLTEVKQTR